MRGGHVRRGGHGATDGRRGKRGHRAVPFATGGERFTRVRDSSGRGSRHDARATTGRTGARCHASPDQTSGDASSYAARTKNLRQLSLLFARGIRRFWDPRKRTLNPNYNLTYVILTCKQVHRPYTSFVAVAKRFTKVMIGFAWIHVVAVFVRLDYEYQLAYNNVMSEKNDETWSRLNRGRSVVLR